MLRHLHIKEKMARVVKIPSFWKLVIAVLVCELIGISSGLLANTSMNNWFATLQKPSWNPPAFLFGPVWTLLYLIMGISFWLVWKSIADKADKREAMIAFVIQLIPNFFWSILFFRLQSPLLGFVDIALMIYTISITIYHFRAISLPASWLMAPYLLWVCFAAVLNFNILILNT